MALTVSLTGDWLSSIGSRRASQGTITFDSSYATGGESLTAANIGLGVIDRIEFNQGEDGYTFKYDYTNSKVMAFRTATHTHVLHFQTTAAANAVTAAANSLRTAAAAFDVAGVADSTGEGGIVNAAAAAEAEVGSAVDLSAVVVEFWATGR